jgi:hypothetical protein
MYVVKLMCTEVPMVFSYLLIFLTSLLIFEIYVFSLFYLRLSRCLSILLIFFKDPILSVIDFLFTMSKIFALTFQFSSFLISFTF